MSFLIADEDKTFIYALGPGGTNTFFCQVQSAGPERICKAEKEAVAALIADAPALLEALQAAVAHIERNTCTHDETHRGGFLWEVCDHCGAQWADDDGGNPEFKWPDCVEKARALIAKHRGGV